jgi:hypothetical protein
MKENGKKIILLREKGKTYGDIQKILNLPKSTIAWWAKKARLTNKKRRLILEKSRRKWRKSIIEFNRINAKIRSDKARKARDAITLKAKRKINKISKRDLLLIGASLFWAEGSKSNKWHLCFANSDPEIIKVIMKFFREVCLISNEKIKALVHIYPKSNYKKVLTFWTKITKLSKRNFWKPQTQISRASKRKRNNNTLPYGTIHLTAGDTAITSQVKGWIQGISKKI